MNVELLRKIQAHNTEHPEQLDMACGAIPDSCGTAGCIAGLAVLLAGLNARDKWDLIKGVATRALELRWLQADVLFYASRWPKQFTLSPAARRAEYAAIVNARIDHFIETGGAE